MANNLSFLPDDYLEKKVQRRTNIISLALFVVVMGAVIAAYIVTDRQREEVRQLQRQVNVQFEDAAKRLEQLDQMQQRKQEMIRKAKVTAVLLERVPRTLILAEMINNMPSTLSLLDMELTTRALPAPAPRALTALDKAKADANKAVAEEPEILPTEIRIELSGIAPTDVQVAQFMTALSKSALFRDINLMYSEETRIEEHLMRKFRLELVINQEIDVSTIKPMMVKRELKSNPMDDDQTITPGLGSAGRGTVALPKAPPVVKVNDPTSAD